MTTNLGTPRPARKDGSVTPVDGRAATARAVDGSRASAGATTTATMPGPTCAPITARPPRRDLAVDEVRRRAGGRRCSASAPARSGLARWATATSTWRSPAASTASSSSRLSACADVRTFSSGPIRPSTISQQRLDRQRRAEQGGGGADPAAATEVLQGVDVEQRRRRVGAGRAAAPAAAARPPASSDVGGGQHGEAGGHADLAGVDDADRHRGVARGELGGLEGAAHLPRQVHRDDLGRRRRGAAFS